MALATRSRRASTSLKTVMVDTGWEPVELARSVAQRCTSELENGHGYCEITITAPDLKKHIAWVRDGMKDIEGATNSTAA